MNIKISQRMVLDYESSMKILFSIPNKRFVKHIYKAKNDPKKEKGDDTQIKKMVDLS